MCLFHSDGITHFECLSHYCGRGWSGTCSGRLSREPDEGLLTAQILDRNSTSGINLGQPWEWKFHRSRTLIHQTIRFPTLVLCRLHGVTTQWSLYGGIAAISCLTPNLYLLTYSEPKNKPGQFSQSRHWSGIRKYFVVFHP